MREAALVLAAGKGTRMRSSLPKVLHPLAGRPMLMRVLDTLVEAGFAHPTVLVGYGAEQVERAVGDRGDCVPQGEMLGTGHAVRVGLEALPGIERLLVVHGDEPLIGADTIRRMLDLQREMGAAVVLLTTEPDDTRGFGRLIRRDGRPRALVQESDLSQEDRAGQEVNLGAYVFDAGFLQRELPGLAPHQPKGEYYLTDLVARAAAIGAPVGVVTVGGGTDVMGVNDLVQLEEASGTVYRSTNRRLMESGVTIVDSASTFIDDRAEIAPDTVIHPFTIVSGAARIGTGCRIGPHTHIVASRIGDRCAVQASTLEEAWVGDDVTVGPYAHLRPGARIEAGAEIGNYAEVKGSTIGPGTRMHHFGYIGDAAVGAGVNIGAGTVTCNFDGTAKHRTTIEDGAFIGSDTMLRAPVTIGENAATGAGSVVTHDVPSRETWAGVPARPLRREEAE